MIVVRTFCANFTAGGYSFRAGFVLRKSIQQNGYRFNRVVRFHRKKEKCVKGDINNLGFS